MGDCARFVLPRHTPDKDAVYEESSSSQSACRAAAHGARVPRAFAVITGSGKRTEAAGAADQSIRQSAVEQLQVPLDRPGEHGRPHRRHRGLRERSEHHLRRLRGRRRLQVGEQRHDVRAGVRNLRHRVDRRHRDPPDESRTSFTSAPASRTTARRRRSATASTRPPTAARPSRTSGCKETQTIARIVIDPKNPETVYVASPGHLFGPNPERGIFKTTDGGKTWNKIKFIDDDTGFTDIAIDPSNSNILYAASYQRRRSGCCFNGGGPGSALWKTTDAGKTWTKLTGNGLPAGHLRPHRARRVAVESERRLRADRGRRRSAQPLDDARRDPSASTEATPPARLRRRRRAAQRRRRRRRAAARPAQQRRSRRRAAVVAAAADAAATTGATTLAPAAASGGRGRRHAHDRAAARPIARRHLPLGQQGRGRGRSSATATRGRCTSASCASIRANDKAIYVAGLPVAKSLDGGKTFATLDDGRRQRRARRTSISTRSGSIRRTRSTCMIGNDGGLDITLGPGQDLGLRRTRWRRRSPTGSPPTCDGRTTSTPACRTTAAGAARARRAAANGITELGLVRHRRRRRIPDRRRSDRLQHRLHRVAGRQHEPLRPAHRPRRAAFVRAPARARRSRSAGAACGGGAVPTAARPVRGGERRPAGGGGRGGGQPNVLNAGRRRRPIASTGTRRSCCRRTTRASSGSAATGCSSRTTAATPGSRAPISRSRSIATRSR